MRNPAPPAETDPAPPATRGRRGRPTRARAEAIDQLVVQTARQMFLDAGYGATAMEAIAAGAGVSKGTLYSRYPAKADLFAAVVEDRVRVWAAQAGARDAPLPQDLRLRLEYHVRVSIESMGDPDVAGFANMMMAARGQFPELARIYFERAILHQVALVARDITASNAAIAGDLSEAIAFALLESALGWSMLRQMDGVSYPSERVSEAAHAIVDRTLRGFGLSIA